MLLGFPSEALGLLDVPLGAESAATADAPALGCGLVLVCLGVVAGCLAARLVLKGCWSAGWLSFWPGASGS